LTALLRARAIDAQSSVSDDADRLLGLIPCGFPG
jgi:hypothetical protein